MVSLLVLPQVFATNITVQTDKDIFINQNTPNGNWDSDDYLLATNYVTNHRHVLTQWNLTDDIEGGQIIINATLRVRHCYFSGKSGTLQFYEIFNHSWDDATVTWNTRPDWNDTMWKSISYSYTITSNSTYDITEIVRSEYEEDRIIDLRLYVGGAQEWIVSSENGCLHPELNINYRNVTCGDSICDTEYNENQETCCLDCGSPEGLTCVRNKNVVGGMARFWLLNIFGTGVVMLLVLYIYNLLLGQEEIGWKNGIKVSFRLIGVFISLIVVFYLVVELLVRVFG